VPTLWPAIRRRGLIVFCALDHIILVAFTVGNCQPYEQISSALWTLEQDGKVLGRIFRPVVDFLLAWLESGHCERVWKAEMAAVAAGLVPGPPRA
jgi:hypothetical protein